MSKPHRPNADYVFLDEDDDLELAFTVEFAIVQPERATQTDPGSPGGIDDVAFVLESVTETTDAEGDRRTIQRAQIAKGIIAKLEREMERRYIDLPSIREEVEATVFASMERD